jgi:hypothetical protein
MSHSSSSIMDIAGLGQVLDNHGSDPSVNAEDSQHHVPIKVEGQEQETSGADGSEGNGIMDVDHTTASAALLQLHSESNA